MNEKDTAKEFQARRRKTFLVATPLAFATLSCFLAILLIGIFGRDVPMLVIPVLAAFSVLFLSSLILVVTTKYRCPKCNQIPWTDSFTEQGGLDLNPEFCSKCHAPLK